MTKKVLSANAREIKKTGGGTANLISDENRDLFNFNETQIQGLSNSVDDDSADIISINPMAIPTTSSVKLENGQKESRKRKIDNNDADYHALKVRHLEVMTKYYEKKSTLIDFQIKEIMQKSELKKKKTVVESATSSDSE